MRTTTVGADDQVVASLYGGELVDALDPRQAKEARTAVAIYSQQEYAERIYGGEKKRKRTP
jgi:hypothetical protein